VKRWSYWILIGAALLALVALIGWAGAYSPLLTPRASEEWSRGRLLGVTPVSSAVDVQAAPGGGAVLAWVDLDDRLHVARLGTRGQIVVDRTPGLGADLPREPHFLVGPEGEIHLIWRETGERRSLLMYARLDDAASVQVGPLPLSLLGDHARSPCLAFNRRGGIEVFWTGRSGVYHVALDVQGEGHGEPVLLVEGGQDVSVLVDQEGILHLAWLQEAGPSKKAMYYASFDPEQRNLSQPEEVGQVFLRAGQRIESLVVGIDSDTGYVLWVIQDLREVSSRAQYAFFPLEIPRQKRVRDLRVDGGGNPLSPGPVPMQYETLLVAMTETVMTPDGPQLQIGVIALRRDRPPAYDTYAGAEKQGSMAACADSVGALPASLSKILLSPLWSLESWPGQRVPSSGGTMQGLPSPALPTAVGCAPAAAGVGQDDWPEDHYVVTASARPSLKPSLAVDAQGNLHLTWLETGGFGVYRVAYASTAPGVKGAYDALTLWDVVNGAMGVAMQLFLALGLAPLLAIVWSLLPLMWLIGYHMVTGYENVTAPGAWVAFGVSALLEVVSTYLISPYRSSLPAILYWTLPLATAAVALALAVLVLRKRRERSLFGGFFVFALTHGFLQVVIGALLRL
jgi:hypothetical protein